MRRSGIILVLLSLWAVIYLASSGHPPALLDDADSVHAEAAREMAASNDWITLHANEIRYLEKAPLMYWLIALSYKVFGVSEFSSRLPVALSVLGLMFAIFQFGSFAFGQREGFYSAIVIGSCVGIFLFTRVLWPDVMLTTFISLSLYCFVRAAEGDEPRAAYGIYVFAALGVLTKGIVGAAFPAIIIGSYLVITRRLRLLRELRLFSGAILFLLIAAPWHIAAGLLNPGSLMEGTPHPSQGRGFFWFYFINEHVLRYLGKRYPADYDTVPLALFIGLHVVWLFPWSFFLPLVVRDIPRRLTSLGGEQRITLLLTLWAGLIILFFCFSTTQEYYTMPAYPAFSLLAGRALARSESEFIDRRGRKPLVAALIALAVLGLAVFAACVSVLLMTRGITVEGDISSTLSRNPDAYALSLGHMLDLTTRSMALFRIPIAGTALAFLIGTASALWFGLRGRLFPAVVSLAFMMAIFFSCARMSLAVFEPYLSSRTLAEAVAREYRQGDMIVVNGEYESASSVNFYTRITLYILNGRSANLEYGSYFRDAPRIFFTTPDLVQRWSGPARIYLISDDAAVDDLKKVLPAPVFDFAESGGKRILSNQESNSE